MESTKKKTLLLGWGNPDREDDGVAWYVLKAVAVRLGLPAPEAPEEMFPELDGPVNFIFDLQLYPEISEIIAEYERVCFVDAHTGAVPNEINLRAVESQYQKSPLTHHMTADTCMALVETVSGKKPEALLVSVRGYQFRFERSLSPGTAELVEQAAQKICEWLGS